MKRVERAARQHRQERAALEFLQEQPDLFIRDEMANGWRRRPPRGAEPSQLIMDELGRAVLSVEDFRKQIFKDSAEAMDRNEMYVRPDPDPAPALSPELWDKLFGGKILDLDGAPHPLEMDKESKPVDLGAVPVDQICFPCPNCNGSGYCNSWDGTDYWTCPACNGDGSAEAALLNMEPPAAACPSCSGSGFKDGPGGVESAACPDCEGKGTTQTTGETND